MYDISLLPERIRNRIKIVGTCWIWQGYINKYGYGRASFRGHDGPDVWLVHRITYTVLKGAIPEGLGLDHLIEESICTSKACCNPDHVQPLSRGANVRKSPNTTCSIHALKTHCPKGHPYSNLDNVGARRCRKCRAMHEANRRERLKLAS